MFDSSTSSETWLSSREVLPMGLILAIDTATPVCSVALYDETGLDHLREQGTGVHSTRLGGMIQELLEGKNRKADSIHTALISSGPGSYTGLRIAASFLKGFLFQRDVNVVSVPTLPIMAYERVNQILAGSGNLTSPGITGQTLTNQQVLTIHTVLDARRQHLYHWKGQFTLHDGVLQRFEEDLESKARELSEIESMLLPDHLLGGIGLERLSEESKRGVLLSENDLIHAGSMIRAYLDSVMATFFKSVDLATFAPDYLS